MKVYRCLQCGFEYVEARQKGSLTRPLGDRTAARCTSA